MQEKTVQKLLRADNKIKEYEGKLGVEESDSFDLEDTLPGDKKPAVKKEAKEEKPKKFIDLPSGSNRKKLPI